MNRNAAKHFILLHARPVDLAVYQYFFENGSKEAVVKELACYQNEDGGFGKGLEPDYLNPNSSPIATNDAVITLFRVGALKPNSEMVNGIVRYLKSHDSFDEEKKRWMFAIDSNKDYPTPSGGKKKRTESMDLIPLCPWRHFWFATETEPQGMRISSKKGLSILKRTRM